VATDDDGPGYERDSAGPGMTARDWGKWAGAAGWNVKVGRGQGRGCGHNDISVRSTREWIVVTDFHDCIFYSATSLASTSLSATLLRKRKSNMPRMKNADVAAMLPTTARTSDL
jgi:hypothetical protein